MTNKMYSIGDLEFKKVGTDVLILTKSGKQVPLEDKVKLLVGISGTFIFPEFYPHTHKEMWKILNPYTNYAEHKIVLHSVEDGFEKSLDVAIYEILQEKNKFYPK